MTDISAQMHRSGRRRWTSDGPGIAERLGDLVIAGDLRGRMVVELLEYVHDGYQGRPLRRHEVAALASVVAELIREP